VAQLKTQPNLQMALEPDAVKHTFLFQTRDPLMSNVKLRQAIAASLDLKQLVAGASDGLGTSNQSAIPPSSAYHDATQNETYAYDPAKAKALLAEAGYKGEKITILANKRAVMPSFSAAIIAQAMMQAAGINAEVEVLDWATQLDRYNSGKYQMSSFSYSSRLDPALSYEQFAGPKDKQPRKVWENPRALKLIADASAIAEPEKRQPLFDELHKLQLADTPLIILFNGVEAWVATKRIQGFSAFEGKPRAWDVSVVK
jgi:peptide/nickel transport system substrate-binding protein